ncbi:MAG: alpha/beta hydrolase [Deltaproteobacteria bacterium]|nr:alpha/beta hydrolase [Deltaproteobacteria bacterium]
MRGLMVPGLNGSGPEHWQTLWEKKYAFERVEQRDWDRPAVEDWVRTLDAAITRQADKAVLIAHSLGCCTAVRWVERFPAHRDRVLALFLVAPPDIATSQAIPASAQGFALEDPQALPFPSLLVGSENDPYMDLEKARALATALESRFVNAGPAGHINVDSGHGPWPKGESWLRELRVLAEGG